MKNVTGNSFLINNLSNWNIDLQVFNMSRMQGLANNPTLINTVKSFSELK